MQHPRALLLSVLLAASLVAAACKDEVPVGDGAATPVTSTTTVAAAPPRVHVPELPLLVGAAPADPVAAIAKHLPGAAGWCVQIRSVPTRLEADRLASEMRSELGLDVALMEKDLGERGVWWRVCVGHEPDELAADARAKEWTGASGALKKHMAEAAPGQAAYQLLEREGPPARQPSPGLALALLRARADDERRPLLFVGPRGALYGAVSLPSVDPRRADAAILDDGGRVLGYLLDPPDGCEACAAALSAGSIARRVIAAGDVTADEGDEILIEERGEAGTAVVSVLAIRDDAAVRRAWFLLGTATPTLRVLGEARALDADGEAGDEIALARVELPLVGDRLCALRESVELFDLRTSPPKRLDEAFARTMGIAEQTGGALPTKRLIAALDELGDADAASRACASYLESGRDPTVAGLCIARVGALLERGRSVSAVNAAGLLSAASEALRAAVAGPFFKAASQLDQDPRLVVGGGDCESAPLVDGVGAKRLEHVVRLARLKQQERVELGALVPEVFVTGQRDFGPKAPVGQLTALWLERLRDGLPARHALLQAKLGGGEAAPSAPVRPTPEQPGSVSTGTAPGSSGGAGYIHIEVHGDQDDGEDEGDGDDEGERVPDDDEDLE